MWRIGVWVILLVCLSVTPVIAAEPGALNEKNSEYELPTSLEDWFGSLSTSVLSLHPQYYPEHVTLISPPENLEFRRYECSICPMKDTVAYQFRKDELVRISLGWTATEAQKNDILIAYARGSGPVQDNFLKTQTKGVWAGTEFEYTVYAVGETSVAVSAHSMPGSESWGVFVDVFPAEPNRAAPNGNQLNTPSSVDQSWALPASEEATVDPERYKKLRKSFIEEPSVGGMYTVLHPKDVELKQFRPYIIQIGGEFFIRLELEARLMYYIDFDRITVEPASGKIEWFIPPEQRNHFFQRGTPPKAYGISTGFIWNDPGTSDLFVEYIDLPVQSGADEPGIDLGDLQRISEFEEPITLTFYGDDYAGYFCKAFAFAPLHDTLELFQLMGGELPYPLVPRSKLPKPETTPEDTHGLGSLDIEP